MDIKFESLKRACRDYKGKDKTILSDKYEEICGNPSNFIPHCDYGICNKDTCPYIKETNIPYYMDILRKYWSLYPELRFGQICSNLFGEFEKDFFFITDEEFFSKLEKELRDFPK